MVEIEKTAYPRFSRYKKLPNKELQVIYTPSTEEILLAEQYTKDQQNKFKLLVLLKSFQKLGYFVQMEQIPEAIKKHIALCLQLPENIEANYKNQKTFHSHKQVIRQLLGVNAFDQQVREVAIQIGSECAYRINSLPDIINNIIEELLYKRYELPAFSTLCKLAKHCKATVNDLLFKKISDRIPEEVKKSLEDLTKVTANNKSTFNEIKLLPKKPTTKTLSHFIAYHNWLLSFGAMEQYLTTIIKEFINEAKVIDANGLKDLHPNKRLTLIVCLLYSVQISGVDNLVKMLCKIVNQAHKQAKRKLDQLRLDSKWKIIDIVALLSEILDLIETNNVELLANLKQKVDAKGNIQDLKNLCTQMIAFAKQDYLFLVSQFMSKTARNSCFNVLQKLQLTSATNDNKIIATIKFMLAKANSRESTFNIGNLDLSFIGTSWQKIIFSKSSKQEVIKEHFEVSVLTEIANEFRAGDLITTNSELFCGYKSQLLSKEEYSSKISDYCNVVNISATGKEGVRLLKEQLLLAAKKLDDNYQNIKGFTIDKTGTPILSRPKAKTNSKKTDWLKHQLKIRIQEKHVLDVLCSTNHQVVWTKHFEHISGTNTRIEHAIEKYILTLFAIGTSMGISQIVKHFKDLNGIGITPHMLYLISKRHINIPNLDKAIKDIINEIFQYQLIGCWGDGKSCAADGTLRNIYEDNLLAEYHLRYGARGGIAYYHVANNYIAFFASFIPCGVWEAIAILEGLLQNKSDLQPDTIHADTQGQTAVAFALAYLLGIKLMPRIRNWKEYTMFKADKNIVYSNIESLFTRVIDWELIEECWEDFMQVVLSIKAGTISTKFLLQQLTNYARKNKLLKGLQELGYVIRTLFLKSKKYYVNMEHIKNKKDYIHAYNFLWCYRGSVDTFNAYRREIERLLQWTWLIAKKPLPKINKELFEKYLQFCKKPYKSWIGFYKVPRFINSKGQRISNPKWRPFVVTVPKKTFTSIKKLNTSQYKLSKQSLKEIFSINQSFYNYLLEHRYVTINPIAQIRQKTKYFPRKIHKTIVRKLSDLQWSFVIETAEVMAQESTEHERLLFIMNMLYSLYLRISELTVTYRSEPQMRDFYRDHDGGWWFKTIGKGNKERSIPVSDALLKALKRYRKTLDLPALPSPQEETPLLPKQKGKGSNEEAEALKSATVHWLRHTGISNDVKFRPREHVRDDAGHSSSAITDKYIDVDLKERYLSAKNKKIKVI